MCWLKNRRRSSLLWILHELIMGKSALGKLRAFVWRATFRSSMKPSVWAILLIIWGKSNGQLLGCFIGLHFPQAQRSPVVKLMRMDVRAETNEQQQQELQNLFLNDGFPSTSLVGNLFRQIVCLINLFLLTSITLDSIWAPPGTGQFPCLLANLAPFF